jgi:hypothetical protein
MEAKSYNGHIIGFFRARKDLGGRQDYGFERSIAKATGSGQHAWGKVKGSLQQTTREISYRSHARRRKK